MTQGDWYYCMTHRTVEPYEACKAADRLGPYETRFEAEHALDKVGERNEEWEAEEERRRVEEGDDEDPDDRVGWGPFRS